MDTRVKPYDMHTSRPVTVIGDEGTPPTTVITGFIPVISLREAVHP